MAQITSKFLLVDDDPINNFMSTRALKKYFGEVQIDDFTIPEDGLVFINSGSFNVSSETDGKTTLFLDINMPSISGWEFLDAFKLFEAAIKEQFNIYILTSSVDHNDIEKAKENPLVIDFIEKPLNNASLIKLFGS